MGKLPPAAICLSTTFDRQLFGCHETAIACSLYVNLLRHFQRVVDFDPQVAHRAIEFRVAEQQLDRIAAMLYLPSAAISDFAFCRSAVAVEGFFVTESSARIARARREAASARRSPAG
jgi:hypothetical protein